MLDFDSGAIMVYGIPASADPSPSTRVEYDISKLRLYFSKVLAEDESVSRPTLLVLWELTGKRCIMRSYCLRCARCRDSEKM